MIEDSVSAVVPVIRNNSVHVQLCCQKKAILDLWRDRCETRTRKASSATVVRPDANRSAAWADPLRLAASTTPRQSREAPPRQSALLPGAIVVDYDSPIAVLIPVIAEQFGGMLRTTRAVSTSQRVLWAILVTPPANSLGVFRMQREWFGHLKYFTGCQNEYVL